MVGEARLPATRLADDRHDPAVAAADQRDRRFEQGQLVETADERDVAPHRSGAGGGGARDEPGLLGLLTAADLGDTERLAGDRRGAQGFGGLADQHAARRGQRLEPRGGVDDVAHRCVVGPGDRTDEHLARVDADAHLDVAGGVAIVDVLGDQPGEGLLHAQGGAHRPVGVVFVGHGSTEQGDDGVAEDLVDTPAEGLDLDDERLEVGLDEPGDGLRVEVLGECRVADDVGEQHGDDTALLDRQRDVLHGCSA